MSVLYSFEKDHLIRKLDLPDHMLVVEYNDLFVFCAVCATGKFIATHNDKYYNKIHQELSKKNIKFCDDEYGVAQEKITSHFMKKISEFISQHKLCESSLEEIIHNKYCL